MISTGLVHFIVTNGLGLAPAIVSDPTLLLAFPARTTKAIKCIYYTRMTHTTAQIVPVHHGLCSTSRPNVVDTLPCFTILPISSRKSHIHHTSYHMLCRRFSTTLSPKKGGQNLGPDRAH
jgi:hypothetical protein